MVEYEPTNVLPMGEFPLAWRITDERWAVLPPEVLGRLKPLSATESRERFDRSPLAEVRCFPLEIDRFRAVDQRSLVESGTPEQDRLIQRWFQALPIDPSEEVYACWGQDVAIVTDWGTLVATWSDLWYPFDRLGVFDETGRWALVFGSDEVVTFLEATPTQSVRSPKPSSTTSTPASSTTPAGSSPARPGAWVST